MTEMTCNDFIKSMKAAGFDFTYRATDGTRTFTGEVKQDKTTVVKITPVSESRQRIKDMFKQ